MSEALSVPHLNTEEESRPEPVSNVTRETFECIGCLCTCHPQLVSHVWMKPTFLVFFFYLFFLQMHWQKNKVEFLRHLIIPPPRLAALYFGLCRAIAARNAAN